MHDRRAICILLVALSGVGFALKEDIPAESHGQGNINGAPKSDKELGTDQQRSSTPGVTDALGGIVQDQTLNNSGVKNAEGAKPNITPPETASSQLGGNDTARSGNETGVNNTLGVDPDSTATEIGGGGKVLSILDTLKVKVMVGQHDTLSMTDLSMTRMRDLLDGSLMDIYSVDFHHEKRMFFFAANNTIYSAKFEGRSSLSDVKAIVTAEVDGPVRLAVDWVHDKLYWMADVFQTVEVADLDGSNRRLLFDDLGSFAYPNNIAVDPYLNVIFIVSNYTVFRCDLNKKDLEPQLLNPVGNKPGVKERGVRTLALDRRRRHVYMTGLSFPEKTGRQPVFVTRSGYDGKQIVNGTSALLSRDEGMQWNDVYGMDVFMDTLYFAHFNVTQPDSLWKVNLTQGVFNAIKFYVTSLHANGIWSIRVLHPCVQRPDDDPFCKKGK